MSDIITAGILVIGDEILSGKRVDFTGRTVISPV